jgi:hypothetical protein
MLNNWELQNGHFWLCLPNKSPCNAGITCMQIIYYDWTCAWKKWDAEGNNPRLLCITLNYPKNIPHPCVKHDLFTAEFFTLRVYTHIVTLKLHNFLSFWVPFCSLFCYGSGLSIFMDKFNIIINIREKYTFLIYLMASGTRAFGRPEISLELPTW